ncbi:hypothetical protein KIW84_040280 [Lathyrus oleraceus]|uniref:Uncharacterized protein n=1 Tax=Pisum sativum TaxID=3888 RepID=A0A9D4X740_PEA|nr:hypothetical protein KIW84_040280 [Pisum sativum]
MSSDAIQDQMQNLKYQKHLKWNLDSRSSDSGQNYKVSEASEHEVKSRSSDSEQMSSVKPRVFREGDLVLKKILSFKSDSRGKRTPNYEGPYVVKRDFSSGALILTTMDGEEFIRPVNADAVKKYFA